VFVDKISRRLFGWNGNQRNSLVGWLEPNNFWLILLPFMLAAVTAISRLPFSLLLLLGSLATRTEKTKRAREHLPSHTLNYGDDVASVEGLRLVADLLFLHQE